MSRKEQDLKIVRQFEDAHQREPFDLHEVYRWAKENNLWHPPTDLAEKKFVEEVAQALREEKFTADDGEQIRRYHANMRIVNGRQQWLWQNDQDADRSFLEEGLQLRRKQGLDDVRQIKADMDYFNRKRFSDNPIQMSFNYDEDLAEEEALKSVKKKGKGA